MRKLPRPTMTSTDTLKLCASSIRDADLKNRLLQTETVVETAEEKYLAHGKTAELHTIRGTQDVAKNFSGKEMERVYNGTFVKSQKTRDAYAQLKKASVNDICPLCGQGTVRQLDHYLPITGFPVYGLTTVNLIPACSDCNKNKSTHTPSTAGEQTIHPYFDDIDNEQWLFAEVVEKIPAAVVFSVRAPRTWNDVQAERVKTHFRIFKLGALYATHAAVEITNMRFALGKMAIAPDSADQISQYLKERADSCAHVHKNSWQRATFEALSDSAWFCTGGFNAT